MISTTHEQGEPAQRPNIGAGFRIGRLWPSDRGALAIVVTFVLCLPLLWPRIYAVDSVEYYAYLPSFFFDGDLDFTNEYTRLDALNPRAGIAGALLHERDKLTGRPINVAPVGTAILWSPAFLLAHGGVSLARAFGIPVAADGFSQPYIWAIAGATALYGLLGLLLSYHLARQYAGMWSSALAVIVCWLASPVVFFMFVSPPWSHVPALFVTALFIVVWHRTRGPRSAGQWIVLGLLGGLMTLCREQLGLFMLLPALEALGDYGRLAATRRWQAAVRLFGRHLLFLMIIALTLIPQFLAYRALNGRWGPSTNVSGKLNWWSEHFWGTLIDPAHGAFLWTPAWLLAVLGLPLLWRRDRFLAAALAIALVAQVYLNGAFGTTWHLTGSFGFRRLIEATPVFVLGLALLLDRVRLPRPLSGAVAVLLIAWNFGLIAQWSLPPRPIKDGLVWEGMVERQLAIPRLAVNKLPTLLFDRCQMVENGQCR